MHAFDAKAVDVPLLKVDINRRGKRTYIADILLHDIKAWSFSHVMEKYCERCTMKKFLSLFMNQLNVEFTES
jgi:HD superfamily phosphohydrolase